MANVSETPTILSPIQARTVSTGFTTAFHVAAFALGDAAMWDKVMGLNPTLINVDGFWEYDFSTVPIVNVPPLGSVASDGGVMQSFPVPAAPVLRDFNSDFDYRFA